MENIAIREFFCVILMIE